MTVSVDIDLAGPVVAVTPAAGGVAVGTPGPQGPQGATGATGPTGPGGADPNAVHKGDLALSVRDYGAKGDGATDDTAAFTAAVATGGKHLYVPPGTYILNSLTMNQAGQKLLVSPGATLKAKTGGTQLMFNLTAAGAGIVGTGPGATVDGNNVGVLAGNTLWINGAADCTVEGLTFLNCAGAAILCFGTHPTIRRNTIIGQGRDGISYQPAATTADVNAGLITGNYISSPTLTGYGIVVHGKTPARAVQTHITDNHVALTGAGATGLCIEVWGLSPRSVIGNNSTIGGGMGISVSTSDGTTVTGNTVTGPATTGIECATSSFVTITGNTVDGNAVTAGPITLNGVGSGNTVAGNTIRNYLTTGSGRGIQASGPQTGLSIVGNAVSGLQTVYIKTCRGVTVTGNNFNGATVGLDGVALEDCLDCVVANNVMDGFSRSCVFAFTGAMTALTIGPNIKRGTTPAELGLVGTLGAGSRLIRGGTAPVGVAAVAVTASPFTYTNADRTAEAVYVSGGTVSAISKNAVTVFTGTDKTVWLEPGEAMTVTYSVAPTMTKDQK